MQLFFCLSYFLFCTSLQNVYFSTFVLQNNHFFPITFPSYKRNVFNQCPNSNHFINKILVRLHLHMALLLMHNPATLRASAHLWEIKKH